MCTRKGSIPTFILLAFVQADIDETERLLFAALVTFPFLKALTDGCLPVFNMPMSVTNRSLTSL